MKKRAMQKAISEIIATHLDGRVQVAAVNAVAGGNIHRSYKVDCLSSTNERIHYFVKVNDRQNMKLLTAEYQSLRLLSRVSDVFYPTPIAVASDAQYAYLLMPFYHMVPLNEGNAGAAGKMLAKQHRVNGQSYGWKEDNYLGLTLQPNRLCDNWVDFFVTQRLQPQIKMAAERGMPSALVASLERVTDHFDHSLAGCQASPSLLHGDLWFGNIGFDVHNQSAILYDPAAYFGDRECDLAMTTLFGRFPDSFYRAYLAEYPLQDGYAHREAVYQLYHAINHFNLFGTQYITLVETIANRARKSR